MSNSDSFIDEVTEEVRRDRLFAFLRRYGWIGIVLVLAIVGGSAWSEWRKYTQRLNAQAFGDQMLAALQSKNPATMLQGLTGEGPQAALARMAVADALVGDGNSAEAVKSFMAVSADAALPQSLRDMAAMKAVMVGGDAMPADQRTAELDRLAKPGAPFRPLAMEQQAMALLAAGDKAGAIAKAQEILMDAGVSPALQQRASELVVALGGEPVQTQAADMGAAAATAAQ